MTWRDFNARAKTLQLIGKGRKLRVIEISGVAHISAQSKLPNCPFILCTDLGEQSADAPPRFGHYRPELIKRERWAGRPFRKVPLPRPAPSAWASSACQSTSVTPQ